MSSLHIMGCHHVFRFKRLCWVFWWNKKNKLCRYCHRVFTYYFEKFVYIVYDPAVSNQPASYDESTLRWGWFVTSRNIFKRFDLDGYLSFMQTVYLTSWPRSCWICFCAINIKGVVMVLPKPCRTNPALPYHYTLKCQRLMCLPEHFDAFNRTWRA